MRNLLLFAVLAATAFLTPAKATDFFFTGNFVDDDDKARFEFTIDADSFVTVLTYSYAGGVNAAGQSIAAGGFDPILSLYDFSGNLVDYNDDGPSSPTDPTSGAAFDTFFQANLLAGSYTVFVTQYNNFGPSQLPGPFDREGQPDFANGFIDVTGSQRDSH